MTKKIFFLGMALAILLYAPTLGLSINSGTESYYTDDKLNGRYWEVLTISEKSSHVSGLIQGIMLSAEIELAYISEGMKQKERIDILKTLTSYVPATLDVEGIVLRMDDFYADKTNLDEPVTSVYMRSALTRK